MTLYLAILFWLAFLLVYVLLTRTVLIVSWKVIFNSVVQFVLRTSVVYLQFCLVQFVSCMNITFGQGYICWLLRVAGQSLI